MKRLLLASTIGLSMAGCVAPSYNYTPTTQEISKPPIGEITKAYLGDHMLTQGVFVKQDAIYIDKGYRLNMAYDISPGYFAKQGDSDKYEQYKISSGVGSTVEKVLKNKELYNFIREYCPKNAGKVT